MKQATKSAPTILYLITKATTGGAQRYVRDLAVHAQERGYTTTIAYGVPGRLSEELGETAIRLCEIPSLARDVDLLSDIRTFFQIARLIRETRPDVVHVNSSKAAGIGALAARLLGTPRIVYTVHGWPFKEDRNALSRALIYAASWLTGLLSHAVIVITRSDEARGLRMWWVRRKIVYIPLGRGPVAFKDPHAGFREMFGPLAAPMITPQTIRIASLAELTRNKGLRYAIEAVADLKERGVDAVFVNPGDGEDREMLEKLAASLGVTDRIYFPSYVPDAAANLRGFDVFVLPSLKEGMPYVVMEAALAGIPIVTTTAVDPDILSSYPRARFVEPRDSRALADAIVELSKLPRIADGNGTLFPLRVMVDRTLALYAV